MYQATPKQHLILILWKNLAKLRLTCKKAFVYKKAWSTCVKPISINIKIRWLNMKSKTGSRASRTISKNIANSDPYSEPTQKSKIKLFANTINGWKPLFISIKSFILDAWLGSEHVSVISSKLESLHLCSSKNSSVHEWQRTVFKWNTKYS